MTRKSSSHRSTPVGRLFRSIAAKIAPSEKPAHECVICRQPVAAWRPHRPEGGRSPFIARLDAIGSNIERFACPNCHSNDRERHLVLFFNKFNLWNDLENKAVLHFAPELHLGPAVAAARPTLHVMGDLFPAKEGIQKIDLEDIPFPDATFDFVIGNHILEHVGNVEAALAQVRRVLKPGGRFICQTPYATKLSRTFEEPQPAKRGGSTVFLWTGRPCPSVWPRYRGAPATGRFAGRLVPHDRILGMPIPSSSA